MEASPNSSQKNSAPNTDQNSFSSEFQEIGNIGAWYYDVVEQKTWWSTETFRLFDVDPASTPPRLSDFLELVHPLDKSLVALRFQEAISGRPQQHDFRILRPNGNVLWIESRIQTKKDGHGNVIGVEGTNQDITSRKNHEIELAKREALLRSVFDNMLEGIQIIDHEYRFAYLNRAAMRQWKLTAESVLGQSIASVFPDLEQTQIYSGIQSCIDKRDSYFIQTSFTFPDGEQAFFDLSIEPIPEGALIRSQDVTERAIAEQRLLSMEEERNAFFATSNVGMSEWNFQGKALRVNDTSCRLLGYTKEELYELNLEDIVHPDEREESRRMLGELNSQKLRSYQTTRRYVRKDGSTLYALVYVATARRNQGKPESFAAVLIDQSSHVELEGRLIQSQKMEAIGQLAGGIAHDFNNLLTVIMGSIELLANSEPLPIWTQEHLDAIQDASQRAAELTRQLLAFSRRQTLSLQWLNPNEVIRKSTRLLQRVLGKRVELSTELTNGLPSIHADPAQLEQVILNLVVNARDAIAANGRIVISTRFLPNEQIPNAKHSQYGCVEIVVSDTGTGMDDSTINRIYEPFYTTKGIGQGTGLGLAVVHGIVEQCGGWIEARSSVGVGTSMRMLFPARPQANSVSPSSSSNIIELKKETILIVDDEKGICDVCTRLLEPHGYKIYAYTDPQQALQWAITYSEGIDLLVSDVMMPTIPGPRLATKIRDLRPEMRVIFMSGYSRKGLELDSLENIDVIAKPFAPIEFVSIIQKALEG